jgi:Aldo/keto reductase family
MASLTSPGILSAPTVGLGPADVAAMIPTKSPLLTLNNGVQMPALGLGVYRGAPEQTAAEVVSTLAQGYRLIDTAAAYFNERQVGEAIARSGIARTELFVQTKLWISNYGYDSLRAYDMSLRKLGLDAVDLYLLHQPMPNEWERTVAAYHAAETLLADGQVRAIGVSNFSPKHLDDLIARGDVVPAVNQVELHPFFVQCELPEVRARRHRHASLVASGRGERLHAPISECTQEPGDPSRCRRARGEIRQDASAGRGPLAPRARLLGHSEVGEAGAYRRERRRLRLHADLGGGRSR